MKLTVATSYPIHPARGGGQQRVLGLYRALAAHGVAVDVVALTDLEDRPVTRDLGDGLREIRVPKTEAFDEAESEINRRARIPVTDIALAAHHELTPAYGDALAASSRDAAAVVASHPYAQPAIAAACPDLPLLYEAHNVETDLKADMLDGADPAVLEIVRDVEATCCEQAELVLACSDDDAARLAELFGVDPGATVLVPNGCDCSAIPFTPLDARAERQRTLGIEGTTALFVGSWHEPNLVAARAVLEAAAALPAVRFLLVGSAGRAFAHEQLPANVDITGPVHEAFLREVLGLADVALNPMRSGSGTNLKMLQYAAAGVPLISSATGARGLGFEPGEHYLECDPDELADAIEAIADEPRAATERRVRLAFDRVASTFDWPVIARRWIARREMERVLETTCR